MLDVRWRAKVERALEPVGRSLVRVGVTADWLTVVGLACAVGAAVLIGNGYLIWGLVGLFATGIPDILDGTVARHSGRAGPRGAFFDSVTDRVSDAVLLGGVAWYLSHRSAQLPILALAAAALSMLISYERAKAESLGFTARGGLMERAERLVLLGVGLAFDVLTPVLWVMVVLGGFTAIQRFVMVWRQASMPPGQDPTVRPPLHRGLRVTRHRRRPSGDDVDLDLVEAPTRKFALWWEARRPPGERWRWRQQAGPSRRRPRP
ncbi:MAG TPA: CDP-alcohol phosphatidyltransferase family protein [Acidimicrobiia bacterium]|nr:CDP-alcohol phosphatidyltransferase family protein [Acidimicrobiia bacterium]